MTSSQFRGKTALIVPLVLLCVAILEDIVTYKVRQHVKDVYTRAFLILLLTGVGFALAAGYVGPWLKDFFTKARKTTKGGAGELGLLVFYGVLYSLVFYAYLIIERRGPGGLLPAAWR